MFIVTYNFFVIIRVFRLEIYTCSLLKSYIIKFIPVEYIKGTDINAQYAG